eukprot:7378552-Pyramimonas_sp.AAC.1
MPNIRTCCARPSRVAAGDCGALPENDASIKETVVYELWRDFKAWPLQGDERTKCPIPVFYRACQGDSTCVASIERVCV